MVRIRFDHPSAARLEFQPGDELVVRTLTPELESLLNNTRLDGKAVARIVRGKDDDSETATVEAAGETATTSGRGNRGSQRSAPAV